MKKILSVFALCLFLFITSNNFAYAQGENLDKKVKIIYEISSLANSEKYDSALEKCNQALKEFPQESDLYYWRASIFSSLDKKELAIKDYDKAISLNPKDASIYVMRGICKSDMGHSIEAIKDYNKALEINPNESSAYSMRACEKIKLGDFKGANADLDKANAIFEKEELPKIQAEEKSLEEPASDKK